MKMLSQYKKEKKLCFSEIFVIIICYNFLLLLFFFFESYLFLLSFFIFTEIRKNDQTATVKKQVIATFFKHYNILALSPTK